MQFGILGPVQMVVGGQPVPVGGAQVRALLGLLLLRANRVVAADQLIAMVWDTPVTKAARHRLQVRVAELRRMLSQVGETDRLVFRQPGYLLRIPPDELDLDRFIRLANHGSKLLAAAGEPEQASQVLTAALDLWRGRLLEDVKLPGIRDQAARLEAHRLTVVEDRIDADLLLGRHRELVAELEELVAAQPIRERLSAQLMLALDRCGRHGDALTTYTTLRGRLVAELGIEPGRPVQQLHRQILNADPALDQPTEAAPSVSTSTPAKPRQLPTDLADFTGRQPELDRLDQLLAVAGHGGPLVMSAIDGAGGVGKSALAVHAAHRLADSFGDGQLYVDLHGATAGLTPLTPAEVLGRFLRALGVDPAQVPAEVDEAAARFRTAIAGRRLLIVLDNAADAAQVRPLLPASPGNAVLVTSRRTLGNLSGAVHLHLDVLPEDEAVALLGRLVGQERVAAEPEAAATIARLCGYLPLALRIAGARLAARPNWPLSALAARLADTRHRLDELELAEVGVRASFEVSYRELADNTDPTDQQAAKAFPLLALPDGPDLSLPAAARLLDLTENDAGRMLERLVDAQLLETRAPSRYRLHDLLRLYARDLADEQLRQAEQTDTLTRAFTFYTASTWQTLALLRPGDVRLARADHRWANSGLAFADASAALGWLEAERANLTAAVSQAAATPGLDAFATQLSHALCGFFLIRHYWTDWVQINQTALSAAQTTEDTAAQAQINTDLAIAYSWRGRDVEALTFLEAAAMLYRELGDRHGQATSLSNLGAVYVRRRRYEEAQVCLQQGLIRHRELGNRRGQAMSLMSLGGMYGEQSQDRRALIQFQEALAIYRDVGDRHGEAIALNWLGDLHGRQGRDTEALDCLRQSITIFDEHGDRLRRASAVKDLGLAHAHQRRHSQALACFVEALAAYQELDNPYGQARTLRQLGTTYHTLSQQQKARAHWQRALDIFETLQAAEAAEVRAQLATITNE